MSRLPSYMLVASFVAPLALWVLTLLGIMMLDPTRGHADALVPALIVSVCSFVILQVLTVLVAAGAIVWSYCRTRGASAGHVAVLAISAALVTGSVFGYALFRRHQTALAVQDQVRRLSRSPQITKEAATELAKLGSRARGALPALHRALESERDPEARKALLDAIAEIGEEDGK